jgi:cell division initiation protein
MPITARDIHEKEFSHAMRGYKENEVDDFLDLCAAEVDRLSRENKALYSELDQAKRALATSGAAVTIAAPVERVETEEIRISKVSSSEIGDILVLAQNTAEDLLSKAHSQAEKIVNAAEGRASEIVGEAASRKRDIIEVAKVLKQAEVNFRHEYKTLLEQSLAGITEIRMDIDPEAEVSIVTPVEHIEAVIDRPAAFSDEEKPAKAEKAPEKVEEVFVPVEEPAPFDPGILEKTSFIDQVELDDDFEIEEID